MKSIKCMKKLELVRKVETKDQLQDIKDKKCNTIVVLNLFSSRLGENINFFVYKMMLFLDCANDDINTTNA